MVERRAGDEGGWNGWLAGDLELGIAADTSICPQRLLVTTEPVFN